MAALTDSGLSSPLSSLPPSDEEDCSETSSALSSPRSSISPPPEMFSRRAQSPSYLLTPPLSQSTSESGTPTPYGMDSDMNVDKDGVRPAKRRRISKERTTEYLDLRNGEVDAEQQPELDRLMKVLTKSQKIVAIAGAGISVSAGIPDFRSSSGLFRSLKEEHKLKGSGKHLFDASVYKDDTSTSSFHDMVSSMSRLTKDAKPTSFHHMLATIAKEDRLLRLYSQNVDGIDTSLEPLKTSVPLRKDDDCKWPRTVQLHGGLDKMVCSKCHELSGFDADLFSGPTPPLCPRCEEINDIRTIHEGKRSHGIGRLRPRMVLYNEHNPDDVAIGKVTQEDLRKRPDAVIVAGTTLKVPGVRRIVREMCGVVRDRRGGVAIWINNDLPPVAKDLEDCFDIIVQGPCDEVASHAAMRKWYEPAEEDSFSEISDEDAKKAESITAEVHVLKCLPTHVDALPPPSSSHFNSSFRAPCPNATPRKVTTPENSPICSSRHLILPSIETDSENITVSSSSNGLLTPTKSHKSSPAKKLPSFIGKLKDTGKPKKPVGRPPATAKKSNVKYVKPHSKTKTKSGAASKAQKPGSKTTTLTSSFKATKTSSVESKLTNKKPSSPSKLRQTSNASSTEPMHTLPPQHPRNNISPSKTAKTSPSKGRASFPGLQSENLGQPGKKRPLSVTGITD